MKEIKRYNLLTGLIQVDLENGKYIEHSDHLKEVEQLQARIKELESAERTLIILGYENKGGELWKPPVGKKPDFSLIDRLNKRIADYGYEYKKAFNAFKKVSEQLKETEDQCNKLAQKIRELESEKPIWAIRNEARLLMIGHIVDDLENETDINKVKEYLEWQLNYYENKVTKHD